MNEEVQGELSLARETLREAEHLLAQRLPRGVGSRAYYAMFHAAAAMVLAEGEKYEKHGETIGAFGRLFVKRGRVEAKFNSYLKAGFKSREVADYEPLMTISLERANEMLQEATEFVAMAEEFLKGAGGAIE